MKLGSIHHVAIIVSDYERSKKFYVEKLGFEIIRENYRAERGDYKLDLKLDGCELEIFSAVGNPPRPSYPGSVRASPSRLSASRARRKRSLG